MITLNGIALTSDLLWIDEYAWSPVAQQVDIMSDGAVVVQAETQQTGRSISLLGGDSYGYVKKSVVEAVRALSEEAGLEMTLVLNDGSSYNVVFVDERFTAEQACDNNNPSSAFQYFISLYLMEL